MQAMHTIRNGLYESRKRGSYAAAGPYLPATLWHGSIAGKHDTDCIGALQTFSCILPPATPNHSAHRADGFGKPDSAMPAPAVGSGGCALCCVCCEVAAT